MGRAREHAFSPWLEGICSQGRAGCQHRLRSEIQMLATETAISIGEIPPSSIRVQSGEREATIAKKEMVEANRLVYLIAGEVHEPYCSSLISFSAISV